MIEPFDEIGKQAGEQLEGYFPGLPDRIAELNFQQYGRAIIVRKDYRDPESIDKLVGYILPLQEDQGKHLIIFNDGFMLVTEPDDNSTNYEKVERYKNQFRPHNDPLEFDSFSNLPKIESSFIGPTFWGKVSLRNDNLSQQQEIAGAIRQAVIVAKELKERRLKAKVETVNLFLGEIDGLLYSQPNQQPAEPPSADYPKENSNP